jgi:hypothetical protein
MRMRSAGARDVTQRLLLIERVEKKTVGHTPIWLKALGCRHTEYIAQLRVRSSAGIRQHLGVGWSRTWVVQALRRRNGPGAGTPPRIMVLARQGKHSTDRSKVRVSVPLGRFEEIHIGVVRKVRCLYFITTRTLSTPHYARHIENVAS